MNGLATPPVAFGAVVVVLAIMGALDLRAALADLNWPIILLLAAMIPLGEAVAATGAARVLAASLMDAMPTSAPLALVAAMLLLAILITPFVNNATTAVVLSPIAVAVADAAGLAPHAFLIAVAIGASTDFLTPFGHHNNTLAFGIGGYRFSEFPRAGWPLTLTVIATALPVIWLVWL